MVNRTVIILSLLSFLNFIIGCTSTSVFSVPPSAVAVAGADTGSAPPLRKIVRTDLVNGDSVVYDAGGGRYMQTYQKQDSVIVGKTKGETLVVTPIREVRSVNVEKADDEGKNTVVTVIVVAVASVVAVYGIVFAVLMSDIDGD